MAKISKRTRDEFREMLVGITLREIRTMFDGAEIRHEPIPADKLPHGQRRGLVEEYYATIDWNSPVDTRKVLRIYEEILSWPGVEDNERTALVGFLRRDGFSISEGRVTDGRTPDLLAALIEGRHSHVLAEHVSRIERSVDEDPALAIGAAKELVESTAALVIEDYGGDPRACASLPALVKQALKHLDLASDDVPDAKKGSDAIRKVLASLGQVVGGTAELRNLYGTGHGRSRRGGLQPRHARLVTSAAVTITTFVLETWELRRSERDQ